MDGNSILNYIFDYNMCLSIDSFSQKLSTSTADVYIVMSRKAACFISFLKRHGMVSFDGTLVTDRILDFDCTWLKGKNIIVIDDVIVSGTTIFSVIQKLNKANVQSIKVYVLGVNERYFNPEILTYSNDQQEEISYLQSPYLSLSDAACMRTCSNIVSTFALDIMPYDVDFPKHGFFHVSNSVFDQLVASSDWYSYDVSSNLQAENDIKNVTMLPSEKIKKLFNDEACIPVSELGFFKVRLFAKPNEKRTKYTINAIPYFLFNEISDKDVSVIFDSWFHDLNCSMSNIAKIRILQYVFAEKLFKVWTRTLNTIISDKIAFNLDLSELSLIIPKQLHSTILNAIDTKLSCGIVLESVKKLKYLDFNEVKFKSKITAREDQQDNMAVLQTKLVEPFTVLYFTKEKESRESVLNYGKDAFTMQEYRNIIDRLSHGYSYRALIHLLDEYPIIYDKETTVSLFIDEALDAGVIVPIIAEERDSDGNIFYFRAYRHGEDVPFGELQEKLCSILLSEYAKEGGLSILTKVRIEKMLVLFIHIGLTQRIFSPTPHDSIYYNVNVDAYLHGNITTVQDPTSIRSYHYLRHRSDAVWLTNVLEEKGIIQAEESGKITGIEDNIDIDVDNSTRSKVSGIGKTFAQLYKNSLTKTTPYLNDDDLILFSTCMYPKDTLNALAAELAIFEDRWRRQENKIKHLLSTNNEDKIVSEISSNDLYTAINSGQKKFFNFLDRKAQARIDEISEQLDASDTLNIYGVLWNQFWSDTRNWNERSIDGQLFNTILIEGKLLLIFNLLCRLLFISVLYNSSTGEYDDYLAQICEYQEKLKLKKLKPEVGTKKILSFSQKKLQERASSEYFDLNQSLEILDQISKYLDFIPELLTDVELLVDRHGKTRIINRYVNAIHFAVPEEEFSNVGANLESSLRKKKIDYQLFPIASPTAIFPESGIWIFLKTGKIKEIIEVLSEYTYRYPTFKGTKVYYKLSENLRLKAVNGVNTKHQFGKFSSYAYKISEQYSADSLEKSHVYFVIENSRGNAKETRILKSDPFSSFGKVTQAKAPNSITNAKEVLVFTYKRRTSLEKYRKEYSNMSLKKKVFISYSEDNPEHVNKIKTIAERLCSENIDVFFYDEEPFGTDLIKFMRNIQECDITLIMGTPTYKRKAQEIDSSGVSFEDRIIASTFMSECREKIVPIAFGCFSECIPVPFNTLKGMTIHELSNDELDLLTAGILHRFVGKKR